MTIKIIKARPSIAMMISEGLKGFFFFIASGVSGAVSDIILYSPVHYVVIYL